MLINNKSLRLLLVILTGILVLVFSWYILYLLVVLFFRVFGDPTVVRFRISDGFNIRAEGFIQYLLLVMTSIVTFIVFVFFTIFIPISGAFRKELSHIIVGWLIPFIVWTLFSVLLLFTVRALFYLIATGTVNPTCSTMGEGEACEQVYAIGKVFLPIWRFGRHIITVLGTIVSSYLLTQRYQKVSHNSGATIGQ